MSRSKQEPPQGQYISGMEVTGIDPEIVREEQAAADRMADRKPQPVPAPDLSMMSHNIARMTASSQGVGSAYPHAAENSHLFGHDVSNPDDGRHYASAAHAYAAAAQPNYLAVHARAAQAAHLGVHGQPQQLPQPMSQQMVAPVPAPGLSMLMVGDRIATPPQSQGAGPVGGGGVGSAGGAGAGGRFGRRRVRLGWTEEETRHLMEGCKRHGVGNWKKILNDPSFEFNCRTAVDLKDRFRTSFPEEYARLYPNARTHKLKRPSNNADVTQLVKINRKERRAFTPEEDERLLKGFLKHGPAWSKIQRDPTLNLSDRRSTDLRDRFRNAFPERYTAAGYKGRQQGPKNMVTQNLSVQPQSIAPMNVLDDNVHMQPQNMMPSRAYLTPVQHPMQMNLGYQTPQVYYPQMGQMNMYRPPQNQQT